MLALLMTISLGIAYAAATDTTLGTLIGFGLSALGVVFWLRAASHIEVTQTHLRVGRLNLERSVIGKVEVLDAAEFLKRLRANAKTTDALLFTRSNSGGVVVEILDSTDHYRHWVISSRNPQALASALNDSRTSGI